MDTKALDRAVEHFGSQVKLAEALDVHPMAVSHWRKRGLPVIRARQIEDVTEGAVTREELLPEIFGDPRPDQAVSAA